MAVDFTEYNKWYEEEQYRRMNQMYRQQQALNMVGRINGGAGGGGGSGGAIQTYGQLGAATQTHVAQSPPDKRLLLLEDTP